MRISLLIRTRDLQLLAPSELGCRMRFLITGDCRAALLLCSLFSQSMAFSLFDSLHECHWNSSASTSLPELTSYQRFSLLTVMLSTPFQSLDVSTETLHRGSMVVCQHSQRRSDLVLATCFAGMSSGIELATPLSCLLFMQPM